MDKHFSLYLDLVRLLAAVLVVLSHFSQHGILGDPTTVSLGRGR
jgi:peptidoglycan/LPS O-acetylase OafA/YrhL